MTNKEALQILNCERVDEAKDAYELLLFDLKLKFLQQIPPLKLIDASIKKIERLNVAFNSLVNLEPHFVLTKINVNWSDSLDVALNGYQLSLTKIRLKIANTLNIQVSRKNKNIIDNSKSNHLLAGFPNHSLKKFIDILIQNFYTIVLVEQTTPPPNPKRELLKL